MKGHYQPLDLLTPKEASQFLKIKEHTLRYYVFNKSIPYTKVGRNIRFKVSDLNKWVAKNSFAPISKDDSNEDK